MAALPKPPTSANPAPRAPIVVPQAPGAAQAPLEAEGIRNLMVNYIPTTVDEIQLRQLFEMYGPVESAKIVLDRDSRSSRGYGFVKYRFALSAVNAIQYLNGYPLMNKRLKVAYANQTDAQKQLTLQSDQAVAAGMGTPVDPNAMAAAGAQWAQIQYMQQLAALQMMQFQQQQQHAAAMLASQSAAPPPPQHGGGGGGHKGGRQQQQPPQ